MTKNKLRKAAVVAIAGLMMAQTALTGCGKKTVDYDVDGTQSQEEGGDKKTTSSSRDGIGGKLGIPDGCDETINVGNSGLGTITIKDDDIEVPDTDKMDVMHITPTKISNEEKKNIAEKVFEKDKGIYMYDEEHQTKSDYEEQIASYKEMIDEAKEEGDTSWQTYMEEEIKTLEEEMAKAPDEYTEAGDYDADGFLGTRDGMQYQLYIYNASDDEEYPGMGSNVYIAAKDGTLDIRPYEGAASAYCSDYLAPGTNVSANASSMSKEEAEDIAG
ncbi:MAG: DUF6034 family protein, partial [Coprococcus sp.]